MTQTVTDRLAVPGAALHYEVRGTGPALVLIHGGGVDAGSVERLAEALADRRTVISYDQRGYGRSPLDDAPDGPSTISPVSTDADDAGQVIEALAGGTADVFGSSSGAIVALELLIRHPDRVGRVVLHEPPIVALLPDAATRQAFFEEVHATYLRDGADAAMQLHLGAIGMAPMDLPAGVQLPPQIAAMLARIPANQIRFLENEIRRIPGYMPDLAALPASPNLVLAGGTDSRDQYPAWPNHVLAERLGLAVVDFPGDHIGYVLHPAQFADRLLTVLGPLGTGSPE